MMVINRKMLQRLIWMIWRLERQRKNSHYQSVVMAAVVVIIIHHKLCKPHRLPKTVSRSTSISLSLSSRRCRLWRNLLSISCPMRYYWAVQTQWWRPCKPNLRTHSSRLSNLRGCDRAVFTKQRMLPQRTMHCLWLRHPRRSSRFNHRRKPVANTSITICLTCTRCQSQIYRSYRPPVASPQALKAELTRQFAWSTTSSSKRDRNNLALSTTSIEREANRTREAVELDSMLVVDTSTTIHLQTSQGHLKISYKFYYTNQRSGWATFYVEERKSRFKA